MPPKALTNPALPVARYRKGKAPVNAPVESDSDDSEDNNDNSSQPNSLRAAGSDVEADRVPVRRDSGRGGRGGKMAVALKDVEVKDGKVMVSGRAEDGRTKREQEEEEEGSSEYETDTDEDEAPAPKKPVYRPPAMPGAESEEGSSEYETDSEDEPAPMYKPVFVSKRNRDTLVEREKLDPEVLEAQRLAELEKQKKDSHNMVADSILREISEKETKEVFPDVDDTDGLDPTEEFEAWKLRELTRLKRDKEAQYAREKEREEVEARRALPEALRLEEDLERAQKSRDEKKKGQQVFLQKYHHKGAFYVDSDILKKHDYTAPTVSTNKVAESLPAVMQKRNFGKAHQTKYTHLAAEDTSFVNQDKKKAGGFGAAAAGGGGSGCFNCGGPHLKKDCPDLISGASNSFAAGGGGGGGGRPQDGGWKSRTGGGGGGGEAV